MITLILGLVTYNGCDPHSVLGLVLMVLGAMELTARACL